MYACDVIDGRLISWMAFDPKYGPENQKQIDWHIRNDTRGAENWEVGHPTRPFAAAHVEAEPIA